MSAEYEAHKARADEANARKEQLFEEAKHLGGIGDRSADSHLRQLEDRIQVNMSMFLSLIYTCAVAGVYTHPW